MKTNFIVKKSEELVSINNYRFSLGAMEMKLLNYIVAKIHKDEDDTYRIYRFNIRDFVKDLNLNTCNIEEIKKTFISLRSQNIQYKSIVNFKEQWNLTSWICEASISGNDVEYSIPPKMHKLLFNLQEKFLSYNIENIAQLKSGYSIQIYEILLDIFKKRQYISSVNNEFRTGTRVKLDVEKLRQKLQIPDSVNYGNFKKILNKAAVELRNNTDISFKEIDNSLEEKDGRKVSKIIFQVYKINRAKKEILEENEEEFDLD